MMFGEERFDLYRRVTGAPSECAAVRIDPDADSDSDPEGQGIRTTVSRGRAERRAPETGRWDRDDET